MIIMEENNMKRSKLATMAIALVLVMSMLTGCGGGGASAGVEKTYWSIATYIDTTWGAEMNVTDAYQLNISGGNYQLTKSQHTTQDVWIDISYNGSLFGTCTVADNGDTLVYTLNAPTRAIYSNGQIEAVTTSMEPVIYDSDNNASWPDTLDGETAPSKDAIINMTYMTVFGLGETAGTITVTVNANGQIVSIVAN